MRRLPGWLCATALSALCICAYGKEVLERPRIGLALSGGGARGAAHVGVLKVLEELRVPVDCVVGTSMGSIVGGGFAIGIAPKEMERIISTTNWNEVFTDHPPRNEIPMRRKDDDYKNLFAPEFGVRGTQILAPKGVIAGISIESFLRDFTAAGTQNSDFQKLPIPYRAIAADLETGKPVILERGSLPAAMRASMSLPGIVPPVESNGRLLVDGGIANNLPIDVARDLCGDVVIAVNIGTPPLKRKEIGSIISIVGQLVNLLGNDSVERQLATLGEKDILIKPELGDISAASFDRASEAIIIGEQAARAMSASLQRYSLTPDAYARLRKTQAAKPASLRVIDEIRFEGLQKTNAAVLRNLINTRTGEPLSEQKIGEDLRRIYGRGDFEGVNYHIDDEEGRRVLVIDAHEKSWGPDYLRFGVSLQTDFRGENDFNAGVSYKRTWLSNLGAEWSVDAQVGRDTFISSEFYQPFDEAERFFIAPYGKISQNTRPVFLGEDQVARYLTQQFRLGADLGISMGPWGDVRVGPVYRRINAEVNTGSPILPDFKSDGGGVRARFFLDQLDRPFLPREGYSMVMTAERWFDKEAYNKLEGRATYVKSFGQHTFSMTASGGSNLGTEIPYFDSYRLGGPFRLSSYRIDQFAGSNYALGRLMYYNRIFNLPSPLGNGVYLGGSLEVGRVASILDKRDGQGTLKSASVFFAADTFLGPGFLGFAGGGGETSIYLMFGVPY
ncbi:MULTISPECIES: patatin-like phospholipase family protein [Oxalobacteraceae]|uniref:patatin-like phospholipase family protein n=1 Tax=Herminiimonas sp. Marseille-P9896 TaxID=2742211 RepID=UPI0015899CFE|nr:MULTISPECIES: patatin-like phospholipase family protein [Oxalobacteraceae]